MSLVTNCIWILYTLGFKWSDFYQAQDGQCFDCHLNSRQKCQGFKYQKFKFEDGFYQNSGTFSRVSNVKTLIDSQLRLPPACDLNVADIHWPIIVLNTYLYRYSVASPTDPFLLKTSSICTVPSLSRPHGRSKQLLHSKYTTSTMTDLLVSGEHP